MTDNRYGDKPLGKSVEEVEGEQSNRVNSSVPGEVRRDLDEAATFIPAVIGGGGGGTAGTAALVNPGALIESGSVADDRTDNRTGESQAASADRRGGGWADADQVSGTMPDRERGTSES